MNPSAPSRTRASRSTRAKGIHWTEAAPAPVVLISGPEDVLAERALRLIREACLAHDPSAEIHRVDASQYSPGTLGQLSSPSLFEENRVIEVTGLESMTDDFLAEMLDYLRHLPDGVVMTLSHRGGNRGKKLLDALKTRKTPVVEAAALSSDSDKTAFARDEFRRVKRRIDEEALRALVAAIGGDIRELAAGCQQIIDDIEGHITVDHITELYGGRQEVTTFKVADAAMNGQTGLAVELLRHAVSTGVEPVVLVAGLASKLRLLARVIDCGSTTPRAVAAELKIAPWQAERSLKESRNWDSPSLAAMIALAAQTDAMVKGESRDPLYAVERLVLGIAEGTRPR